MVFVVCKHFVNLKNICKHLKKIFFILKTLVKIFFSNTVLFYKWSFLFISNSKRFCRLENFFRGKINSLLGLSKKIPSNLTLTKNNNFLSPEPKFFINEEQFFSEHFQICFPLSPQRFNLSNLEHTILFCS